MLIFVSYSFVLLDYDNEDFKDHGQLIYTGKYDAGNKM